MPRAIIATPLGMLAIESSQGVLTRIHWIADPEQGRLPAGLPAGALPQQEPLLAEACSQLTAWFTARLERFDLPLAPAASQRGEALRAAIAAIPYGRTASYGAVARAAGSAPRALGQACARNPFPIVIPCHRVVAAGGALGHYSGGQGVKTKLALLKLESPDYQASH